MAKKNITGKTTRIEEVRRPVRRQISLEMPFEINHEGDFDFWKYRKVYLSNINIRREVVVKKKQPSIQRRRYISANSRTRSRLPYFDDSDSPTVYIDETVDESNRENSSNEENTSAVQQESISTSEQEHLSAIEHFDAIMQSIESDFNIDTTDVCTEVQNLFSLDNTRSIETIEHEMPSTSNGIRGNLTPYLDMIERGNFEAQNLPSISTGITHQNDVDSYLMNVRYNDVTSQLEMLSDPDLHSNSENGNTAPPSEVQDNMSLVSADSEFDFGSEFYPLDFDIDQYFEDF